MRFEGDQLRAILAYQVEPVVVRDGFGRTEVEYENPRAALAVLRRGNYYGVGHAKRMHAHLLVYEPYETLPLVQDGLNL